MIASENYEGRNINKRPRKSEKKFLYLFLLLLIAGLAFILIGQYNTIKDLDRQFSLLEEYLQEVEKERITLLEKKDAMLQELERLTEENKLLEEENRMMRSHTIIYHGNRETNKVAITIDDGSGPDLVNLTLEYLRDHNVKATFFPMGSWVERYPEIWKKSVEEGHELGNHTFNHTFLSSVPDEEVRNELNKWQEAVDEALGFNYRTLFFRPPGIDGFTPGQARTGRRLQEIIADKGMFTVLWDVELLYALRNEAYTSTRITEHVLQNARGGSIVLLHFNTTDIRALPDIIIGLRQQGLEPCSLSELLLTEPSN